MFGILYKAYWSEKNSRPMYTVVLFFMIRTKYTVHLVNKKSPKTYLIHTLKTSNDKMIFIHFDFNIFYYFETFDHILYSIIHARRAIG